MTIPFSKVRGGKLQITASVTIGATTLYGESKGLQITGTNPSIPALLCLTPNDDAFKKLMRLESGLRQFLSPACPLFSADNLGGVGLCQITRPAPTDDQVWSWKANLQAGWSLYQEKERIARRYLAGVGESAEFRQAVKAFNENRVTTRRTADGRSSQIPQSALKTISMPDFTPEQLQRDTLRGFNGYIGGLHEYTFRTASDGLLFVSVNENGLTGVAEWHRISAQERAAFIDAHSGPGETIGDPSYVDDVEAQPSF